MLQPRRPRAHHRCSRGFTLLELMLVIALLAVVVGMATLSLRDGNATRLEEEGERLSALLEGARAKSRSTGVDVRWMPADDHPGFNFVGLPASVSMPSEWLDDRIQAEVIGDGALRLGPEPVIGAQRVILRLEGRSLVLATDGLGPFVRVDDPVQAETAR
jgi:general secretion pathway protein H